MAVLQIPQYSDGVLIFDNLQSNIGPNTLDLSIVDDFNLVIAEFSPSTAPIANIQYSITPSAFTIDNVAKQVKVQVPASTLDLHVGRHYTNLWLLMGGKWSTHIPQVFDVVATIVHA